MRSFFDRALPISLLLSKALSDITFPISLMAMKSACAMQKCKVGAFGQGRGHF